MWDGLDLADGSPCQLFPFSPLPLAGRPAEYTYHTTPHGVHGIGGGLCKAPTSTMEGNRDLFA
jgi:hypothetical protein